MVENTGSQVLPFQLGTLLVIIWLLGFFVYLFFFLPSPLWKVPGRSPELLLKPEK